MSCHGCLTKFTFFTREHSCPNCGFSYCTKCLKNKVTSGAGQKNVCNNCSKKEVMASSDTDIPDLLVKRLETLENPSKPPITIFRHSNRLANLKSGLSLQDKEILDRLEKLKAERIVTALPDESEIKRRLALLQDKSEESINEKPQIMKFPSKSEQEQVDDLLNNYMSECSLEGKFQNKTSQDMDEISERLKKLHSSETSSSKEMNDGSGFDSEDSDAITATIIKRAIAEGQLERRLNVPEAEDDENDVINISDSEHSDDEFPWCIICNENATLKCFGCDRNLYCDACFKQGHEFFNMADHAHVPYKKKDAEE